LPASLTHTLKFTLRVAVSAITLSLLTLVFQTTGLVNATTVALSFLLVVLAVAAVWGLAEAIACSVLGSLLFNYSFLPPIGRWTIADPQNWVALFAFLAVSIVASHLSEAARDRAREAVKHQQETERLYALSRRILLLNGEPAQVASEVAGLIRQTFDAPAVALHHAESGQSFLAGEERALGSAAPVTTIPVSLGGKPLGKIALAGVALSDGARAAIANLAAIALETAHSRGVAIHAESARQSEEFKSTLLDALAHELKTPLTSLKAASTALLHEASARTAPERELLAVIGEETDRLNSLISETLQMARLEAGKLHLNATPCSAEELLRGTLEQSRRSLQDRAVELRVPPGLPDVEADRGLIHSVLRNLLENSARYSRPGGRIAVSAEPSDQGVQISVADEGPGLGEPELSAIFEKYYRVAGARDAVPGMGLGLAIAREIVAAHGGRMWAESTPGRGMRVSFTLPITGNGAQR
jgi:two-component system sensor histidine kinase KdpD